MGHFVDGDWTARSLNSASQRIIARMSMRVLMTITEMESNRFGDFQNEIWSPFAFGSRRTQTGFELVSLCLTLTPPFTLASPFSTSFSYDVARRYLILELPLYARIVSGIKSTYNLALNKRICLYSKSCLLHTLLASYVLLTSC